MMARVLNLPADNAEKLDAVKLTATESVDLSRTIQRNVKRSVISHICYYAFIIHLMRSNTLFER